MIRSGTVNRSALSRASRRWSVHAGLLGLVLAMAPALARAQSAGPRFEVQNYVIDAQILTSQHLLSAKARVDIIPSTDITTLAFELHSNLRVQKVVDSTGQDVSFRQDGQMLNLSLLNPLPGGKPASITVTYGGMLGSADGSPVEGIKVAYIGPEGTYLLYPGRWFPVSGYGMNRFSATMNITVPSDEVVIASGKAASPERQTGQVTYSYTFDKTSFPGTVIAGRYVVQPGTTSGADITLYLKSGHENLAAPYGQTAAKILAYYSTVFGPLPDAHLNIVEIGDDTVGGYTAPGVVALASRAFTNPVNYRLLAQEISHLWWRCLVSPATPNGYFWAMNAVAQSQLAGDWQGRLSAGSVQLRLVLHVTATKDGSLTATMDSVDQGAYGIPVSTVTLKDSKFSLDVDAVHGTYEGTVNKDASEIDGTWSQGQPLELNFHRSATPLPPPAPPKPAPPTDIDGTWTGTLNTGATELHVIFKVVNTQDGLTAQMQSPDQSPIWIPATSVTRVGATLIISMHGIGAAFEGAISGDLGSINGTFTQGNVKFPLVLNRAKN